MNIIILKNTILLFSLFCSVVAKAQDKIDRIFVQEAFYQKLPKSYYIAVLPEVNCFNCAVGMSNQLQAISKNHYLIVIYPKIRALTQKKIKSKSGLPQATTFYLFDNEKYHQLYDSTQARGYYKKIIRSRH
jgi:hypothetical protein